MNKPDPTYRPKTSKDIAGQYKAKHGGTSSTETRVDSKPSTGKHTGHFGKYVDAAVKSLTREEMQELISTYLVDEGFASNLETAGVLFEHMSDEWLGYALYEMRKEDKVAGKKSGGVSDPAYREGNTQRSTKESSWPETTSCGRVWK
jgi:hypothetical protein